MSLWKIAWRSLQQRALSSILTGLSMALGVTLVVSVLVTHRVVRDAFQRNAGLGYDVVIGAKGGKLQLVLNTVYHLSTPVENIPYWYLREFTDGRYKRLVARAIPYCLGDNYQGFRVVGTVAGLLESEYMPGKEYEFAAGHNFSPSGYFEAVFGALAARQTGLRVGDKFRPTHGVSDDNVGHKHDAFQVVGVLRPTGTPNDRAIFINIEGFYLLSGHASDRVPPPPGAESDEPGADARQQEIHDAYEHHEHTPLPDSKREITAILVRSASPMAPLMLIKDVNKGSVAQAVLPIREIRSLFDIIVAPIQVVLLTLAAMIVVVSGVGILVSIYNSMTQRRHEIAVMRALGARRTTVLTIVLLESLTLAVLSGAAGWLIGHGLVAVLSPAIAARTGVSIGFWVLVPWELAILPSLVLLAALMGLVPAFTAYRVDVARGLQ
jgi:putative ABC transport system permease protein